MAELFKFYRLRFARQLIRLNPALLRDTEHVLRLQEQRFRKLIKHAGRASPFYKRKFAGINLETCSLTDLPILTKREMMENFENVVTDRDLRRDEIQSFVEDPSNLGKLFKGRYESSGFPYSILSSKRSRRSTNSSLTLLRRIPAR